MPSDVEAEAADLTVLGEIPKQVNGTFYRIMIDPFYPLQEGNPPVEGDGCVCAFRIHDGKVDMKTRYVDTERLRLERHRLERHANRRLFGIYRNPLTHHPCVRAAIDSTANTNLIFWAGKLVALKESALPYEVHPDTLETLGYDPFHSPGKTFTAHPKVDPFSDELVVFGYEAKGFGIKDIVIYALDAKGAVCDEQWVQSPWVAFTHDCVITENFITLLPMPYEVDEEWMKAGGQHWSYKADLPATFLVAPRRKSSRLPAGWKPGEYRVYEWDHCMIVHTAGAWEEWAEGGVTIHLESSRVAYNLFPHVHPNPDPSGNTKADYVRWSIGAEQPSGSRLKDPTVILDVPAEMARVDERFFTRPYDRIFTPVIVPGKASPIPPFLPPAMNGYMLVDKTNGPDGDKHAIYDPGPNTSVEEPVFIPRSADAPEGDGWVMGMVQRFAEGRGELVVLDTRDFKNPVAVVKLPYRIKGQIHGNWVEAGPEPKSLVRSYG